MFDQAAHSDPTVFAIGVAIVVLIHFVPSAIAFSRNHANRVLILILNILMGWTIIGWAILLYWASKGSKSHALM